MNEVVFVGTFGAGRKRIALSDGRLAILEEAKARKFVEAVDEEPPLTAVWWLLMLFNLTRKTETCLLEKRRNRLGK